MKRLAFCLRWIAAVFCLPLVPAVLAQSSFTISPNTLPNGGVGRPYSVQLTTNGSTATQWSLASGALPPGLALPSSTQGMSITITGTPSVGGSFSFSIRASDPASQLPVTKQYSIGVLQIITSSPLPSGMVLANYSQTLVAMYGTVPYSFNLALAKGETFPSGPSLGQNGTLSGVPTNSAAGTYNFTVLVTDAGGISTVATFALTIVPPLIIVTPSPLPSGTAGTAYSQTVNASGGMFPYTFSTTGTPPAGLRMSVSGILIGTPAAVGTFIFSIQVVDSLQFTTTRQFQLTIAAASPLLQVSPLQLTFAALLGGDAPPPQVISILATGNATVNFVVQIDGGTTDIKAPAWLTVKPSSGTAPGALTVSVDQTGLAATTFTARIRILVSGSIGQSPLDVSVSLGVTVAAPQMRIVPGSLRFAGRVQAPATLEQVLAVGNGGGGGPLSFTTSILGHSPWILGVTPIGGQTAPNSPVLLRIDVNTQGLGVGSYHDVVRTTWSSGSSDVPVSLFVSAEGAILGLNVVGLRFPVRQGNGSSTPKAVKVLNLGDSGSTVNWAADLLSGADWLTLGASRGTASATSPGNLPLSPNANASNFPGGGRYSLVRVSDPQALNSPQYLVAVLDVEPASTPPEPDPSPPGLFFTTAAGTPAAQSVSVSTSSTAPVTFQAATVTSDGANWLTASVATGTASSQTPGVIGVSINSAGLKPATYTGGVNIAIGGVLRTVNVTFVVVPALPVTAQLTPEVHAQATAGCTPARLAITQTGLVNNFAVPAGWPATLIVQLNDDCGNPATNGSAVASFSNGDPPLTLTGDHQTGTYSATWQPGIVLPQMTVTVRATSPQLQTATAQWIGTIDQNPASPPTLVPNGVLNIFFNGPTRDLVGGGLPPGTVAQVYGSSLAPADFEPKVVPLLTEVKGTFMLVGGLQVPLFSVSPQAVYPEINVQIPFELTPNRQYSAIVSANGALTLPETIDVVPLQPGMDVYADGTVIAQHSADYSLVDATHPAKPGEPLIIYLAGMGSTNPSVKSGDPTPILPFPYVPAAVQPAVTVDGQNAGIGYAGLTATGIGLYQINFTVPINARQGNLDLVITQNGISSNTSKLPVTSP